MFLANSNAYKHLCECKITILAGKLLVISISHPQYKADWGTSRDNITMKLKKQI